MVACKAWEKERQVPKEKQVLVKLGKQKNERLDHICFDSVDGLLK